MKKPKDIKKNVSVLNKKIKSILKNNKIYFETILFMSLTIMGIVVSIQANVISQASLELQEIDKMPYFVVVKSYSERNSFYQYNIINQKPYTLYDYKEVLNVPSYKIINRGGEIKDATFESSEIILVKPNIPEYSINGTYFLAIAETYNQTIEYDPITKMCILEPTENTPTSTDIINLFNDVFLESSYLFNFETIHVGIIFYTDYNNKQQSEKIILSAPENYDDRTIGEVFRKIEYENAPIECIFASRHNRDEAKKILINIGRYLYPDVDIEEQIDSLNLD